ncbi:MAG: glycosyltransferase family 1 protein [Candidatus Ozemobacteraceae bacterium]
MTASREIFIDSRILTAPLAGSGNFLLNAIRGFAEHLPGLTFRLVGNRSFNPEVVETLKAFANVTMQLYLKPPRGLPGFLWSAFQVGWLARLRQPLLYWGPNFVIPLGSLAPVPTLLTVLDLGFIDVRDTMSFGNRMLIPFYVRAIRKTDRYLVISDFTRSQLVHHFPEASGKPTFLLSGYNSWVFRRDSFLEADREQIRQNRIGLPGRILLFVGSCEPRKNIPFLLSLMPRLARHDCSLAIVSGYSWGNTGINSILSSPGFPSNRVKFIRISGFHDLATLYHACDAYVSTSKYEGLGMPQLEAMACGLPVVSPRNSSMIEIVDGAGLTVEGWDQDIWVQTILASMDRREELQARQAERLKLFTWESISRRFAGFLGVR